MLGDSLKRRLGGAPKSERPEPDRSGPRRQWPGLPWHRWLLLAAGILLGSFGTGYLLSTQLFFPRPETAGAGVPVPELYGRTLADAEATIRTLELRVGDVRQLRSMSTDSGLVLAQDPFPGQQLLPGGEVSLGVSAGPPELRVPPVAGLTEGAARQLLESVGFDVEVQQSRSDEFAPGVVARTEPAAGTSRPLPARVALIVSSGSPRPDTLPEIFRDTLLERGPDTIPGPVSVGGPAGTGIRPPVAGERR